MGHPEEVDVIVCGGGPAGCVVAGRLAYADPNLKVMLIEGGANNRDDPWVYRPGIYVKNMQRDGVNDKATFYTDTMKSSHLRGRRSIVPCANILGGGSRQVHRIIINFQMYTRASASDWGPFVSTPYVRDTDEFPDDFKTEGWSYKDLQPLMKRLENYQKPCNNDSHGYDGPIAISNGGSITALAQDFLRAADAVGIPYSDCQTAHASEIWAKYINRHTGRRSDAATGTPFLSSSTTSYVHSVMDEQNNLFLRTNARVSRVLFEGNKAVGVAYVPARNRTHQGKVQETIVKARRYVVLSSGTLGTPQILERSGIGSASRLRRLDLKVVSDLPGVGEQYQDHYTTLTPLMLMKLLQYTVYRRIHINSQNPYKEPDFDSGFMNNKADFAPIRWSYKKTREIARRMDAFRGELTSHHPHFHPDSPAACKDIDIGTAKQLLPNGFTVGIHMGTWHKPGDAYDASKVHEDIEYSEDDDKAIDDWVADHVETTWHSLGTCAMKPREEGGVVDGRLNVYGTQGLKCVDLSICPDNLGTNTYSSALLVGEKGADLLAEELGLKIRLPHAPVPHAPVPAGRPCTQGVR
ncbi:choline dehydrogenase [Schizophyllum commune]